MLRAASSGKTLTVLRLINLGCKVNVRASNGETPLHKAAKYGHMSVATCLISYGAKLNARSYQYITPLHLATRYGHINVVSQLLSHNADINIKDHMGNTAMTLAKKHGHDNIYDLLCRYESKRTHLVSTSDRLKLAAEVDMLGELIPTDSGLLNWDEWLFRHLADNDACLVINLKDKHNPISIVMDSIY